MLAPSHDATAHATRELGVHPVMEAVDVCRRFRNGRGVGPMTLRVASGERVALMGPNGAGKTTLLHVLATASRPRAGSVRWYGTSVARKARRFIGAAPDTVLEEGGLTARQSTFFWCRQWMPRTVAGHLVDGVLQQFGLAPVADEPVSSFSFGMRRRLALAQALVHRPRLALLDEPTAGLDPEGVGALMAALAARAWQGHATIVASNDCDFVAASCDRVVFLDGGHLVEDASPKDLLARVGAARVAELEVAPSCSIDELRRVHGVGAVDVVAGIVRVELLDDRALARIVSVADGAGGELLALRVHTPNLGDAFHALTGARLDARPTVMRDAAATPSAAVVGS